MSNIIPALTPATRTMTSKEVAELTGKRHDHVLRDIDNILKTLSPELGAGFSMTYEGDPAFGYRMFVMDRDSTYCLVAGYDVNARMKIIKRWSALESGEAIPAYRTSQQTLAADVQATFASFHAIATLCGFTGNMALLSANTATRTMTGVDPLAVMGNLPLIAKDQEQLLVVTEIAERLDWKMRIVNPRLTAAGLQIEDRDHKNRLRYELTEAGHKYGVYVDTGKKHSDGSPVRQIKWLAPVVDFLRNYYPADQ